MDLYLLTDDGFFGQTRKPWVSLNVDRLCQGLTSRGLEVRVATVRDVGTWRVDPRDSVVFYTFSQKENTRRFIQDVARYLCLRGNHLVPSYDLLLCHENKGFQEFYRRIKNLPCLPSLYLEDDAECDTLPIRFPVVVKTVEGSNARGVFLARTPSELRRVARKLRPGLSLGTRLDLVRRRYFRRRKHYPEYPDYRNAVDAAQYRDYVTPRRRFVVQEFVPGLDHDYRVLAVGSKWFVMKRHTFPKDFRASGTKRFDFDFTLPDGLLDVAEGVLAALDTPFLSMDLCPHAGGFALLEFQALHFGVNVVKKGRGWFEREGQRWVFHAGRADLEDCLAEGLAHYLRAHGLCP